MRSNVGTRWGGGLIGFPSCGLYQPFRMYVRWQRAYRKAGYWSSLGGGALQNMRSPQRRPKREQIRSSCFRSLGLCLERWYSRLSRQAQNSIRDKQRARGVGGCVIMAARDDVGTVGNMQHLSLDGLNDLVFFIEKSIYWGNAGRLGVASRYFLSDGMKDSSVTN